MGKGQGRRAVDRGEGAAWQVDGIGGECGECAETGAGQTDTHVLFCHPAGHPGGLDDQRDAPQVGADQQVRSPRWGCLRFGKAQAAVCRGECRPVCGDQHDHRALALQGAYRFGESVAAGHHCVGAVPCRVVAGHDEPQPALPGDRRQGVDARCRFRLHPQHRRQGVALGETKQVTAALAQPPAVVGVTGVAGAEAVQRAEPPAVQPTYVGRGCRFEEGEGPRGDLRGVSAGQRSQIGQYTAVGAEYPGVEYERVDPVQFPQHAAVHRDDATVGEDAAELGGVSLASAARCLGQRGEAQGGGPFRADHRSAAEHPAAVPLDRAVRFGAGALVDRCAGHGTVRFAGERRFGLGPGALLGESFAPLHDALCPVQHDAGPSAGEALDHRLGEREEHLGAWVAAYAQPGEGVQFRVQVDCGEQTCHFGRDGGDGQDPGGGGDGEAERVGGERAERTRGARSFLGRMRRGDLRVRFVRAGAFGAGDGGDQVAQLRFRRADRHDDPSGRRVDPGPVDPGQAFQRRLDLAGQRVPAVLTDAVHLDVVPARPGPHPPAGEPERTGQSAGGGADAMGGVVHQRYGHRRPEATGEVAQGGHRLVRRVGW